MATPHHRARPSAGDDRQRQVQEIFSEIAPRYDLLNHVLSLNVDRAWRRKAVDRLGWQESPQGDFLDACAGTYDVSVELADRPGFLGRVTAADFALPMLTEGLSKVDGLPVRPVCGDSLRLPFAAGSFHGAIVAFGVRNLADLERGFREFHRVLRPGGTLVILEFTLPPNPVVRAAYLTYFTRILPVIGRVVSGHPWAYEYLPASVQAFPDPEGLAERLLHAGFDAVRWELLTLGVAALHVARK